jgi:hypothetical protein
VKDVDDGFDLGLRRRGRSGFGVVCCMDHGSEKKNERESREQTQAYGHEHLEQGEGMHSAEKLAYQKPTQVFGSWAAGTYRELR